MLSPKQSETIVKVFLSHPTPAILEESEIKKAKAQIKKRYREIRNSCKEVGNARFTMAEIQSKREWIEEYLREMVPS